MCSSVLQPGFLTQPLVHGFQTFDAGMNLAQSYNLNTQACHAGVASDALKVAEYRSALRLRSSMLQGGSWTSLEDEAAYKNFSRILSKVCTHLLLCHRCCSLRSTAETPHIVLQCTSEVTHYRSKDTHEAAASLA